VTQPQPPTGASAVSFNLLGIDAASFILDAETGELSFLSSPNFELPDDTDEDNIFTVTVEATQETNIASLALTISVTDDPGGPVTARRLVSGLTQPVYLEALPDGSGRLIVLELTGVARIIDPETGILGTVPFIDVSTSISTTGEGGLLGLAFSPNFSDDRAFFVNVTNLNGDTEIRRYTTFLNTPDQGDPATEDVILQISQPFSNHNAGWIGFDAAGFLIIPTGDGGGAGDPLELAQDPMSLLGKVLRLDVSSDDFPGDDLRDYSIPAGNTFSDPSNGAPEIFAIGLRNPFRASIDPITGDLFIGDVGQNAIEEIDRLDLTDSSTNFGWDTREGTQSFEGANDPSFTDPVAEYPHGASPIEGTSVTGGYVYNGPLETLDRQYIFGDFITGNIWSVPEASLIGGQTVPNTDFTILTNTLLPDSETAPLGNISSFGEDAEGNLFILTISGNIFAIEAS